MKEDEKGYAVERKPFQRLHSRRSFFYSREINFDCRIIFHAARQGTFKSHIEPWNCSDRTIIYAVALIALYRLYYSNHGHLMFVNTYPHSKISLAIFCIAIIQSDINAHNYRA